MSNLSEWVDSQLEDSGLSDEARLYVLAALEDDEALEGYLDGSRVIERPEHAVTDEVEANGVVLTSITVEGFRGIGPRVTLPIAPKAGLTVVVGRNGSGKSSFSEALELLMTGQTYRWARKAVEWREQWRNLHHPTAGASIGLVEEGQGPVTVTASWADDATKHEQHTLVAQRAGQPQVPGVDHLGWRKALEQYQPILSYDELGGMLEGKQSELYDAIAGILGVEQITDGIKRFKSAIDARKGPAALAAKEKTALKKRLADEDDDRAVAAAKLLAKQSVDVAALRALATGTDGPDLGTLAALRALNGLAVVDTEVARAATARLQAARDSLADAGAAVSQRARARLKVLEQALALHAAHGDQPCPVCHEGTLDADWEQKNRAKLNREQAEFEEVELAHQSFVLAFRSARALVAAPRADLAQAPVESVREALEELRLVWQRWTDLPEPVLADPPDAAAAHALLEHITAVLPDLQAAHEWVQAEAIAAIAALDDAWQPLATSISAWCTLADEAAVGAPVLKELQAAEKWLKSNDLRLKNDRLKPIESSAREVWAKLRQESNVDIGGLELTGTNTSRRLKVNGSVDGEEVGTFAVFSQGELNALTLSLFLPRATLPESPFRFVVIDDPVQAMDPAKVDGLVEVLGEIAQTRQVIVFSHDDRLPAALRRSAYDATILEVNRGARSSVAVSKSMDPTERYLRDAHGLIKEWQNDKLSEDDLRRTLPGLYRFAVESAARDRYFADQLKAGVALPEVEEAWSKAHTTRLRVLLSVFGQQPPEHEAQAWFAPPHRKQAVGVAGGGFHSGLWTDPDDAHHVTSRLVKDLQSVAP